MSGKTNDFAGAVSRYPAADVNPLSTEDITESMIATVMSKELGEITSKKNDCPLNGKCNRQNVVYEATTQNPDPHFKIGVTENFKTRWYHHKQTFKNPVLKNSTALSSLTWGRNLGEEPNIKWEIIDKALPYKPGQRDCQLCLTEKIHIIKNYKKNNCLNHRNEIVQICRLDAKPHIIG